MRFDKVPKKLPDWWDEEEDDEDEKQTQKESGDGSPNGPRSGGSGGSGSGGGSGGDGEENEGNKGIFAALLALYTTNIKTNPIRTKALSTCILALLGDYLAQQIAHDRTKPFALDTRRSLSIGLWAFCFMGPVLHFWYGLLDRVILGRFAVLRKVCCDQILFAPIFNGAFIAGVGALEGAAANDVVESVTAKLWPAMKANWTIWPAAQVVNFALIPRTFQIVYVNCVALVWNVMLTYISHDDTASA